MHGLGVLDTAVPRHAASILDALCSDRPPAAIMRMSPRELAAFFWGYARLFRAVSDDDDGDTGGGGGDDDRNECASSNDQSRSQPRTPSRVLVEAVDARADFLIRNVMRQRGRPPEAGMDFDQQNMANLLWAYAILDQRPSASLLGSVEGLVRTRNFARSMTDQSLSSLLWALGKLGATINPVALETLLRRALSLSDNLSGQSVANIVWALARFGCTMQQVNPFLMFKLANRAVELRAKLNTQEVSNLQWGFARIGARFTPVQLEQVGGGWLVSCHVDDVFHAIDVARV